MMRRLLVQGLLSMAVVSGLGACGQASQDSESKVTNGKTLAAGDYPSVVLLYDAKIGAICTGTFINATTVISAAHCTESGKVDANGNVSSSLSIITVTNLAAGQAQFVAESTKIVRNPLWDRNGQGVNKYDLSLITFPVGVAKSISSLASTGARKGDSFSIVGYGLNQSKNLNDGSSAGIKRIGSNSVASLTGGFIQFKGQAQTTTADGTNSSASSGDSGGPLFINGEVAGITSGGGAAGWFSSSTQSLYIDLFSSESRAFLAAHL